MKHSLTPACLAMCLFVLAACSSSSIDNASLRVRNLWNRLHGKGPTVLDIEPTPAEQAAMDKLAPVPGDELTDEEKLRIVKAQNFFAFRASHKSDTAAVGDSARKLDKLYPTLPRIGEEETLKALLEEPVQVITWDSVRYDVQSRQAFPLPPGKQIEPMPNVFFSTSDGYFVGILTYRGFADHKFREMNFSVVDLGNLNGLVRTAAWYYRRRGFVGQEWTNDQGQKFKFAGTRESHGHLWVIWTLPGSKEKHYSTFWNDRFELLIEGVEDLRVVDKVFNIGWLNAYQEAPQDSTNAQ